MAKKKSPWISQTQTTPSGRKDLDEFKEAAKQVLLSWAKLRRVHTAFETRMDELEEAGQKVTIPKLRSLRRN